MAIKRSEQIDSENGGYYHLMSRCVRRAFLCGTDPNSGKDYNHRRQWIENRILSLSQYFAVEVYAYAVLHNHYHLVVYVDPLAPQGWSDLEIAERWLKVFPGKLEKPEFAAQRGFRLQAIVADKALLATYRERLGSLSWLMRRINEPLAKMANKEDICKGHFWESRFKSQALLDEGAALTCMAYVDLNPIRTQKVKTLAESEYTSIKKRLKETSTAPLAQTIQAIAGQVRNRTMTLKLKDYVDLVEWTANSIVSKDKTPLPYRLSGTLNHFNLRQESWLNQVQHYGSHYHRFVGNCAALKQKSAELGQKWLKGVKPSQELFQASP